MTRSPTIEWQVAGACNYDCSYCIQSRRYRRGRPDAAQIDSALSFFRGLPGTWEIKCSGGEAFAHPAFLDTIVPGLMASTPHLISVLTNLSPLRLFMAAVIPGLMYAGAMMLVALVVSRRRNYPTAERVDAAGLWRAFVRAIWALAMPVLLIAGIRLGVFNVTESSAVAVTAKRPLSPSGSTSAPGFSTRPKG